MYSQDYDSETKLDLKSVIQAKITDPAGWVGNLEVEGVSPQRVDYLLSLVGMQTNSPDEKWEEVIRQYNISMGTEPE